jgi:putative transposase
MRSRHSTTSGQGARALPPPMMGAIRSIDTPMPFDIHPGATCLIDGHEVVYERAVTGGHLIFAHVPHGHAYQYEDLLTGVTRLPDASLLLSLVREGRFSVTSRGPNAPPDTPAPLGYDMEDIDRLDPKARMRRFVVRELIDRDARRSDPDIGEKLKEIWTDEVREKWGPPPIPSTVRRWLTKAQPLDHVRVSDMMSRTGRVSRTPSSKRIDPTLRSYITAGAHYYYTNPGLTVADVCAWISAQVTQENERRKSAGGLEPPLPAPSRSTVRREIKSIECRDTLTEKFGSEWIKLRHRGSGRGLNTQRLLQTCLIDDKKLDAIFVLDAERRLPVGRAWLCLIVDVHTRCILGWHISFEDPTVQTAAETFKIACRPKVVRPDRRERYPGLESIFGMPSELLADNGAGYASPKFEDALVEVGSSLAMAAVRTPTHKAVIERIFRTLDTMLTKKLPGATIDPMLARELGFDPTKDAVLTLGELSELIDEFVYLYHITPHSGLEMQPALAWDISRRSHPINLLNDPQRLDQLVGEPFVARLTRNGIRRHNLSWSDPYVLGQLADDLAAFEPARDRITGSFSATVKVKFNRANLGHVHVWNDRRRCYVTLPSTTPRYAEGLSLFQHEQVRAWARREALAFNTEDEQLAARHALNERIKELAPSVAIRERNAMARMLGSTFGARTQDLPQIIEVEERHDGLGGIVTTDDFASRRTDGGALTHRPPIGQPQADVPSPLDAAITGTDDPDDIWGDADEGFKS